MADLHGAHGGHGHGAHGHAAHGHGASGRTLEGASHGSVQSYVIGFILSVILTGVAFGLMMVPTGLSHDTTLLLIALLAVVQIFVHLVCFLHMNTHSEQRWNVVAFGFAVLTLAILIIGSLWIMHNISVNMMVHSGPMPEM